jgi:hypothetical protein
LHIDLDEYNDWHSALLLRHRDEVDRDLAAAKKLKKMMDANDITAVMNDDQKFHKNKTSRMKFMGV